jgi:hypothetical protein
MKSKQENAAHRCLYDWKDGSAYLLACQVCASQHTTVRMLSLGHDLFDELLSRGMLTGAALTEAQKNKEENEFEF